MPPNNNANPTLVNRKIAVLGFRAVGKTSLTNAFVSGTFSDNYDPTIENTHHKTIRFRKVHFATDIIDTAGMVSSRIGARYLLLLYDVSLFCKVSNWMCLTISCVSTHAFLINE